MFCKIGGSIEAHWLEQYDCPWVSGWLFWYDLQHRWKKKRRPIMLNIWWQKLMIVGFMCWVYGKVNEASSLVLLIWNTHVCSFFNNASILSYNMYSSLLSKSLFLLSFIWFFFRNCERFRYFLIFKRKFAGVEIVH